jgi:hypothetical protein
MGLAALRIMQWDLHTTGCTISPARMGGQAGASPLQWTGAAGCPPNGVGFRFPAVAGSLFDCTEGSGEIARRGIVAGCHFDRCVFSEGRQWKLSDPRMLNVHAAVRYAGGSALRRDHNLLVNVPSSIGSVAERSRAVAGGRRRSPSPRSGRGILGRMPSDRKEVDLESRLAEANTRGKDAGGQAGRWRNKPVQRRQELAGRVLESDDCLESSIGCSWLRLFRPFSIWLGGILERSRRPRLYFR